MHVIADGYVCTDCAQMIANGECDPDTTPARVQEVAEATAGWCLDSGVEKPDCEFSWHVCETCRSSLGGYRMYACKLG